MEARPVHDWERLCQYTTVVKTGNFESVSYSLL